MLLLCLSVLLQHCMSLTCNIEDNIVQNYNIKENLITNNWTICYLRPWNEPLSINALLSLCPTGTDDYLFFGALPTSDSASVYVGAMAPSTVFGYTSSYDTAIKPKPLDAYNSSYNVYWYNYPDKLFGFSPTAYVDLEYCNYRGCRYQWDYSNKDDENRMSWAVDQTASGGRAGSFHMCAGHSGPEDCGVGNGIWYKVVYYKNCGPIAETYGRTSQPLGFVQKVVICVIGIFCVVVACACLYCLWNFIKQTEKKRSEEFGQIEIADFCKEAGKMFWIGIVFGVIDIGTDILYAYTLISGYKQSKITFVGWVSLIVGSVGFALLIAHISFSRKMYWKISVLKIQYQSLTADESNGNEVDNIIKEIRSRKVYISQFAILCACIEDIPQIVIITLVNNWLLDWSFIAILTLAMSIVNCLVKFITLLLSKYGCNDDVMSETTRYDPVPSTTGIEITHTGIPEDY